jgi:CYTH domain-containing protein
LRISWILTLADIAVDLGAYTDKTTVRKNIVTEDAKLKLQKKIWNTRKKSMSAKLKAAAAAEHHLHRSMAKRRYLVRSTYSHM